MEITRLLGFLLLVMSWFSCNLATAEEFSKVFKPKKEITLEKAKQEATNCLTSLKINRDRKIWVADECQGNVKIYTSDGKLHKIVGKKADTHWDLRYSLGQFRMPYDICFDTLSRAYVIDYSTGQVSTLDKDGNFIYSFGTEDDSTWCLNGSSILVDKEGNIFVGGADTNGFCLHKYTPKGKHIFSVFPIDKELLRLTPITEGRTYLAPGKNGNIWCVNSLTYRLFEYSRDGKLVRSFRGKSILYKGPQKLNKRISPAIHQQWRETWTEIENLLITKNQLIILCTRIWTPSMYLLEIYDQKGKLVAGNILTDHKPLTIGQDNTIYFLLNKSLKKEGSNLDKSSETVIGEFALNL